MASPPTGRPHGEMRSARVPAQNCDEANSYQDQRVLKSMWVFSSKTAKLPFWSDRRREAPERDSRERALVRSTKRKRKGESCAKYHRFQKVLILQNGHNFFVSAWLLIFVFSWVVWKANVPRLVELRLSPFSYRCCSEWRRLRETFLYPRLVFLLRKSRRFSRR